nr:hypothetical protein [Tanacetum cinerariifolium]
MQMIGGNGGNQFRQYAGNLNGYNAVQNVRNQVAQNPRVQNDGIQNQVGNGNLVEVRAEENAAGYNGNQIMYGSAEVHENCDNNKIFNMFTQEEQYTELLEPIPEPHQVPQNDNEVISEVTGVEQDGAIVEQHSINFEETRALYESLYQNLAVEVEKVNSISDLNKQLSKEKSTVSFLLEEKKKLKSDFKTYEDELLDKQIKLEKKIKDLNNIVLKREADASLAKHKILELDIERLLKAVVSQDIISVVQNASVVDTSDLQTELERTKERFENCIIKKETKYAKLWNDWYKKCDE